jgi:hypothetical protein
MRSCSLLSPAVLLFLAACAPAPGAKPPAADDLAAEGAPGLSAINPASLEANTKYLSSDELEGRAPGTHGGTLAEDFVAKSFAGAGLLPAGEAGTFFQSVPLREAKLVLESSGVSIQAGDATFTLEQGKDLVLRPFARQADVAVDAPLVFAGYGISRPDLGYDDLAGVDVRGAIAIVYSGAPRTLGGKAVPSALHAVLADGGVRVRLLRDRGAKAVLVVFDPLRAKKMSLAAFLPRLPTTSMAWLDHGEPGSDPVLPSVIIDEPVLERILAPSPGAPHAHDLWTHIDQGQPVHAPLHATAKVHVTSELHDVSARNVLGVLPGSDPALSKETVVYTAHHDHLGVGKPVNGDAIYNGALDDALGVAGLVEIARAFRALPKAPRRSVLFIAVTGEERGLLGSEYFARHPTIPIASVVADVNIDGLTPNYRAFDVVPLGAEHSSLFHDAERAARATGYTVSPDPDPDEVFFIRSDQYRFVQQGVPSVFPTVGYADEHGNRDAFRAVSETWTKEHYHQPSDVWRPEYRAEWAAHEAGFDFLLGLSVAMADERPRWNPGDVFAR